mmetsp:Transcript_9012/g.16285  ORF Transcript_9012/g.16285 Transcript_9012/m.16285 type:complete len:767 (+) Transcript_9012:41-2341(+)
MILRTTASGVQKVSLPSSSLPVPAHGRDVVKKGGVLAFQPAPSSGSGDVASPLKEEEAPSRKRAPPTPLVAAHAPARPSKPPSKPVAKPSAAPQESEDWGAPPQDWVAPSQARPVEPAVRKRPEPPAAKRPRTSEDLLEVEGTTLDDLLAAEEAAEQKEELEEEPLASGPPPQASLPPGSRRPVPPRTPPPPPRGTADGARVPPITPRAPATTASSGCARSAAKLDRGADKGLLEEHPEWARRCTIEAARPGQPQRLNVSMAEAELGDEQLSEWCTWMDKRFEQACPSAANQVSGRMRFKAPVIDLSENRFGVTGIKALCTMLEKHRVQCEVFRIAGNNLGNEAVRCIAKYLSSSSQALAMELHLSRNKVNQHGLTWLLGSLAMHPAYPVWNEDTHRFVPLRLRVEGNKIKAESLHTVLQQACQTVGCTISFGDRPFVDMYKHNSVVHLGGGWTMPQDVVLPSPELQPRPLFAAPGRGAVKTPGSCSPDELAREEPRVLYEDDDVAVVLKPAGWACLPQPKGVNAAWVKLKPLARRQQILELLKQAQSPPLQAWLLLHFGGDPNCDASRDQSSDRGLAHRLDVDTSGPLLIGKTLQGVEHAKKQIGLGVLKDYVVLVHGTFSTDRGECCAAIDTSWFAEERCVRIGGTGLPATTVWEVVAEYESLDESEKYSLVLCRMVTLRTHQIRVHMQHLGHPIVGDSVYGSSMPSFCPRLCVHKFRIGFFTVKGEAKLVTCSLQTVPDLWKVLGGLRKVGGMAMMGCGAPGM